MKFILIRLYLKQVIAIVSRKQVSVKRWSAALINAKSVVLKVEAFSTFIMLK